MVQSEERNPHEQDNYGLDFHRIGHLLATSRYRLDEHDFIDILTSQLTSAVEVPTKARVLPRDVVALGIASQRETTIVWDREPGLPVYTAIESPDCRTAAFCEWQ